MAHAPGCAPADYVAADQFEMPANMEWRAAQDVRPGDTDQNGAVVREIAATRNGRVRFAYVGNDRPVAKMASRPRRERTLWQVRAVTVSVGLRVRFRATSAPAAANPGEFVIDRADVSCDRSAVQGVEGPTRAFLPITLAADLGKAPSRRRTRLACLDHLETVDGIALDGDEMPTADRPADLPVLGTPRFIPAAWVEGGDHRPGLGRVTSISRTRLTSVIRTEGTHALPRPFEDTVRDGSRVCVVLTDEAYALRLQGRA